MDAGPSAVILFVRRPASDARSRTLVLNPVSGGAAVAAAVILFVRRPASDARSRALVLNPVSGGATVAAPRSRPATAAPTSLGLRCDQRQIRAGGETGRATIGRPSSQRSRSAARSPADW